MKIRGKSYGSVFKLLFKGFRLIILLFGIMSLVLFILSFTSVPFHVYYKLGTSTPKLGQQPDYIVVMGAGGMPGPGGLMRSYFASEAAKLYPDARIIIALPYDTNDFQNSDAWRMYKAIAAGEIDSARFLYEKKGTNTYTQACEIWKMLETDSEKSLLVVSSPEHIRRCVLTFKKCGFENVGGLPAFEASFSSNLLLTEKERKQTFKEIGRSVKVRYDMWNYLVLEIAVIREFTALGYYKLKGYI
ncbi:MAG TPA: YdcF family protein [Bacteroidales bacterium]|nr:YdcF family protein [Bacteroidales bacterium]